ncbi:MAG TPA: hypothetical protein VJO35_12300 [Terriglobales bacterium]|nr:hypothetical protein [Terriglobales bacterium]
MQVGLQCFAMRAFEISLNGKTLCVAGIGEDGVLSAIVDWVTKPDHGDLFLDVGGLISPRDEHVQWVRQKPLEVNDEIQVRIIETAHVDEPAQTNRSGAEPPRNRHIGGIIGPY